MILASGRTMEFYFSDDDDEWRLSILFCSSQTYIFSMYIFVYHTIQRHKSNAIRCKLPLEHFYFPSHIYISFKNLPYAETYAMWFSRVQTRDGDDGLTDLSNDRQTVRHTKQQNNVGDVQKARIQYCLGLLGYYSWFVKNFDRLSVCLQITFTYFNCFKVPPPLCCNICTNNWMYTTYIRMMLDADDDDRDAFLSVSLRCLYI